ncbi:MAG TPA: response regulator [Myxococcota bacterium]|nr:response regulator [Myxococcota bacterium]
MADSNERTILVVDDDAALCGLLADILEKEGCRVTFVGNCAEARAIAAKREFQVALIDLRLPDGLGTDFLSEFKGRHPDCLCIVMTAHADLDSAVAAMEKGAFHYLRKPIESRTLLRLLDRVFEIHRLRTQKVRAQRDLLVRSEESEALYLALVEAASDGVAILQDGKVIFLNRALAKMGGRRPAEVIESDYIDYLGEDEKQGSLARVSALLSGERRQDKAEVRFRDRNGQMRDLEISDTAIKHGGRPAVLVIARDVTERRKVLSALQAAKEDAEAANRAKSEFLANMGHELRTPLAGIIGVASLLDDGGLDDKQRRYVETITRSAEVLLNVINDLLDFSRIEAGRLTLDPAPLDMRALTADVVEMLSPLAIEKGLDLSMRYAPLAPHRLVGDAGRIRRVLVNLVDNALKFTERGRVRLAVESEGRKGDMARLRFSVHDTGIGIPGEKLDGIFDKFTQVDSSASRRYAGCGLGLAISKQLVLMMGGELSVKSRPEQGSEFFFVLDLSVVESPCEDEPVPEERTEKSVPTGLKVLVAEDNDVSQEVSLTILGRLGCEIELAADGRQAVEMAARGDYDAIFMDCQMPGVDGFDATKEIRRHEAGGDRHVYMIAMTAHSLEEDRERCLAAGMDDFIAKPATIKDFQAALAKITGRRSS